MKHLLISIMFLPLFLFCNVAAEAFDRGDIAYIEKGRWWTTSDIMLLLISTCIGSKDYQALASIEKKGLYFIQKSKLKIVVIRKIETKLKPGNQIQWKPFGADLPLYFWIWESFLTEK